MKLLAFGEVLWDVYPDTKCIGGAPFNFAAHAARLGAESYLLSAVGGDTLGDDTLCAVRAEGVCTDFVTRSSLPTGQCLVSLDERNVPSYNLLSNVAYDDIAFPHLDADINVFYFGTLALRAANNRAVLREILESNRFETVFADLNIRPPFSTAEAVAFAVENATVLKISEEELPNVLAFLGMEALSYADAARALAKKYKNLARILITLGSEGAYLWDAVANKEYQTPAVAVKTVSTVGAGDSFSAAFLVRLFAENDIAQALAFAAKVAAFVVSEKAAVPPYTIEKFL